jgi:hypothetical protein
VIRDEINVVEDGSITVANKPIRISGHARFEMKRRGISFAQVKAAIRSPGQIVPSAKGRQIPIHRRTTRPAAPARDSQGR